MTEGKKEDYCCPMRARFVIGIVGVNASVPEPVDLADYIDFDVKMPDGRLVVRIRHCPFCGKAAEGPLRAV